MLDVGDLAPDFELEDQDGRRVTLGGLLDAGPLLLFFYPNDFGLVCTKEACAFRDRHETLESSGTRVAGVSPQGPESHRQFRESLDLPYPLLADPERKVIQAFGVEGPLGMVRRASFLIGPDRRIRGRAVSGFFLGKHRNLMKQALEDAPGG